MIVQPSDKDEMISKGQSSTLFCKNLSNVSVLFFVFYSFRMKRGNKAAPCRIMGDPGDLSSQISLTKVIYDLHIDGQTFAAAPFPFLSF